MKQILKFLPGVLLLLGVLLCVQVASAADGSGGGDKLLAKYAALKPKLEKNAFSAPIYLESSESGGSVRVDMYGTFPHPFKVMKDALITPASWCDITSLHINIKACTARTDGGQSLVTLYSGRKYYQPPSSAYPLKLKFQVAAQQPQYLDIVLSADEGPFNTRDHNMRLEAVPVEAGKTFTHFSYSYKPGAVAKLAVNGYFSTLGKEKVGFSTVRKDGKLVYIDGVRGAIERNTMRYYLAVESYLDTLDLPTGQRFEQRLNRWYDYTAKYPRQLKEMDKAEYLANKRREHANQLSLQNKEKVAEESGGATVEEGEYSAVDAADSVLYN